MDHHRVHLHLLMVNPAPSYYLLDFRLSGDQFSHYSTIHAMPIDASPSIYDEKSFMPQRTGFEIRAAMQALEILNYEIGVAYTIKGFQSLGVAGFQLALTRLTCGTHNSREVGLREYLLTVIQSPDYVQAAKQKAELLEGQKIEMLEEDIAAMPRGVEKGINKWRLTRRVRWKALV